MILDHTAPDAVFLGQSVWMWAPEAVIVTPGGSQAVADSARPVIAQKRQFVRETAALPSVVSKAFAPLDRVETTAVGVTVFDFPLSISFVEPSGLLPRISEATKPALDGASATLMFRMEDQLEDLMELATAQAAKGDSNLLRQIFPLARR